MISDHPEGPADAAPEVSIVVPMHNEEACVHEFHRRVGETMAACGRSWELLLVDDGSTDATRDYVRKICADDAHVKGVFLARNRGQCTAIYAGVQHSAGDRVVIMDADLQHRPEDIPRLLDELDRGFDLVSGRRINRNDSLWSRRIPSLAANWMLRRFSGCPVRDMGGFSCIKGDMARQIPLRPGQHRLLPALVYLRGGSVSEIGFTAQPRFAGKSHYGFSRSLDVLFDILMLLFQASFKERPVYLFGRISLGLFCLASLIMAWLLADKLFFGTDMGTRPPFLGAVMFYLFSLAFFSTGFVLESMAANQDASGARPYVVREVCSQAARESSAGAGKP
jgi:glycosyltransferase involved in cell wall biosynthesis